MKFTLSLAGLAMLVAGCGDSAETPAPTSGSGLMVHETVSGSQFMLNTEPDGAGDVIKVREEAKNGEDIVIVGRIGGSADPWVKGRAAFTIVDRSLRPCNEIPGDECPVPWDYCCETDKLPTGTAVVKFNDEDGKLIKAGARDIFELKELDTVVIQGKAKRDDAGNLTVMATGMFVQPGK